MIRLILSSLPKNSKIPPNFRIHFCYNNHSNWRRYNQSIPLERQQVNYKKQYKTNDKPQFVYRNKIIWPSQYNPAQMPSFSFGLIISCTIVVLYLNQVYDRKRIQQGRTYEHSYSI